MSVLNGQPANQDTFNNALVSKTNVGANDVTGQISMSNPMSGGVLANIQKLMNSICSGIGMTTTEDFDYLVTWASAYVGLASSSIIDKIEALVLRFHGTSGHSHTGVDGEGPAISAEDLADHNNYWSVTERVAFIGANGLSDDVSTSFTGQTPGGDASTEGVITDSPDNKVQLFLNPTGDQLEDGSGNEVYGRLTEAAGVWTLTYFVLLAGVETPFSITGPIDLYILYRNIYTSANRPTIGLAPNELGTLNVTNDVVTATTAVKGKTQLASVAPPDISATAAAGTANATVANADHTHKGLHSISKSGDAQLFGDVTLSEGTGVTLNQVGNDIEISASGGGGGGGALQWIEGPNAPTPSLDSVFNRIYSFQQVLEQSLYTVVKVPLSYTPGTPIILVTTFKSPDTTGNVQLQTTATLNRVEIDNFDDVTNQHVSTNGPVALSGATQNKKQLISFDLTDGAGEINGVQPSPGDEIYVNLQREGGDTATSDVDVYVYAAETIMS